jgi:hypothetical protein
MINIIPKHLTIFLIIGFLSGLDRQIQTLQQETFLFIKKIEKKNISIYMNYFKPINKQLCIIKSFIYLEFYKL